MKIHFLIFIFLLASINLFSQVKEYNITIDPADFKFIYENYSEDNYVPCQLTYNGKTWEAEMRIRGDGSRVDPKKSLKLKFSKSFLNGHDAINLNSEYSDVSYCQSYMSSLLYRRSGHPCFDAEHIRVILNGQFLGLYLQIEPVDEVFLSKWGLNPKGNLYKSTIDGASLSKYDDIEIRWEKKTNENLGFDDLKDFIARLNSWSDQEYYDSLKANVDYDNMINLVAMNIMLMNASTYTHNYYVYHNSDNGKWMFIPWDMDKTIGAYGPGGPYDETAGLWFHENPIPERAFCNPQIFEDVKTRIKWINDNLFQKEFVNPILDSLKSVLRFSAESDTTDRLYDMAKYDEQYEKNKSYFEFRYNILSKQFDTYPANFNVKDINRTYTGPVTISWTKSKSRSGNEISYNLYYGPKPHFDVQYSKVIKDIKDTFFTINSFDFEGVYFYKVTAYDGVKEVEAYDHLNNFVWKKGTELCGELKENITLDPKKSPYIVKCDLIVPQGITLTVPKGVELHFGKDVSFFVRGGKILAYGESNSEVKFLPIDNNSFWQLFLIERNGSADLNFVEIDNTHFRTNRSVLKFLNSSFNSFYNYDIVEPLFDLTSSSVLIKDSYLSGNGKAEGIVVKDSYKPELIDNIIVNLPDALEFVNCKNGRISGNTAVNPIDDCIDLNNCDTVIIEENILINPVDKGISIGRNFPGRCDNITVRRNIVYGANIGVAVKDDSRAIILNNTFYKCNYGFLIYNRYPESGPAHADFVNNIFEKTRYELFQQKDGGTFSAGYNLYDKDILTGEGNIKDTAHFVNTFMQNFRLNVSSPAIDSGAPELKDEDGTRSDIGAFYFNQSALPIVINEINYNSSAERNSGDWVELYNPSSTSSVDLSGWAFKDGDDLHNYFIPEETILLPGSYIILAEEGALFSDVYPNVKNILPGLTFGFSGSGEALRLYNKKGELIDSVAYDDEAPWPTEPDGKGSTLELISPSLDNALASSWKAYPIGTPGSKNSTDTSTPVKIIELSAKIVPNPAKELAFIELDNETPLQLRIEIYNLSGELVYQSHDSFQVQSKGRFMIDLSPVSQGAYYVKLLTSSSSIILKGLKLK